MSKAEPLLATSTGPKPAAADLAENYIKTCLYLYCLLRNALL